MNIKDKRNQDKQEIKVRPNLKSVRPSATEPNSMQPTLANNYRNNTTKPQIISGYFIEDKSYKEAIISRINTALCLVIAGLVVVCMVSYYFVIACEIELNKISKETLALNYENEELQAELDRRQSYSNVDRVVSATHDLKRANRILEISVKDVPAIGTKHKRKKQNIGWNLGY